MSGDWNAVILAAGRGRRMGGPKALLQIGGRRLLSLQLSALTGARRVAVVVPAGTSHLAVLDERFPNAFEVPNQALDLGPFHSIRLGLRRLDEQRLPSLIVPVDCPVQSSVAGLLVKAEVDDGAAWCAPAHGGHRGHPVLLLEPGIRASLSASGEVTLRDILHQHPGHTVQVKTDAIHWNLNNPDQLADWLTRSGTEVEP